MNFKYIELFYNGIMKSFRDRVYEIVEKIPKGQVMTYKQVAQKLGSKSYRAVGQALAKNPYAPRVSCHRVVKSDYSLGGFNGSMDNRRKKELLINEGVKIVGDRVIKQ